MTTLLFQMTKKMPSHKNGTYQYYNTIARCTDIITHCLNVPHCDFHIVMSLNAITICQYGRLSFSDRRHLIYRPAKWNMSADLCAEEGRMRLLLIVSSRKRDRLVSGNVFIASFIHSFILNVLHLAVNMMRTRLAIFIWIIIYSNGDLEHRFNTLRQRWGKVCFNIFCATFQNNVFSDIRLRIGLTNNTYCITLPSWAAVWWKSTYWLFINTTRHFLWTNSELMRATSCSALAIHSHALFTHASVDGWGLFDVSIVFRVVLQRRFHWSVSLRIFT